MTRGLALPWKLLMELAAPTVTLLLAWMSIMNNSRTYLLAALLVVLAATLVQVMDRWSVSREENYIRQRTIRLIGYLSQKIDRASQIEQRIRGDQQADEQIAQYRDEIATWRTETGNELERLLPRTGASQIFLAALGETGRGPLGWEYSQLRGCQTALVSILGSVDSFVRRARASR